MAEPQLVIMAAGIGSRYGGLKQIDPLGPGGEILVDYAIFDALKAGFRRVVFVIRHYFEDDFKRMIGRKIEQRAEVAYAYQEIDALPQGMIAPSSRTKPWGTGHAALMAKPYVDAPAALINADDYYGVRAFEKLYEYLKRAQDGRLYDYCMVGYVLQNTLTEYGHVARGVCTVSPDGFLQSVVERTKICRQDGRVCYADGTSWIDVPPDSIVSMNMWGVTPGFFAELERRFAAWLPGALHDATAEFFLPTVVNDLLREGKARVRVMISPDCWYGVTYREDKPIVAAAIRRLINAGVYPPRLWE